MNKETPISIIGVGHLGLSILKSLIKKGHQNIFVTRRDENALQEIHKQFPIVKTTSDNKFAIDSAEIIILATKEANFADFADYLKNNRQGKLIISTGPTFSLKKLEALFGPKNIRLVPLIDPGDDILCYSFDKYCASQDKEVIPYIFGENISPIEDDKMPIASNFIIFRGLLNSFFEPLCTAGVKAGFEENFTRKVIGKMLISTGTEIEAGLRAEKRLENASGGYNEKSFTLGLYKNLKPIQDDFAQVFSETYEALKAAEK